MRRLACHERSSPRDRTLKMRWRRSHPGRRLIECVTCDGGDAPGAYLDENAVEIRLLRDHRDTLVNERTRLITDYGPTS